ncbi:acyltransferase family protein [Neptunicella marina]|uniref:Acyltransferase family protein n=1 Tax=Neptunicella marina TaxID=2125989 RepID=A0A8J6LXA5_9ALTE|nr:acyltransferase family protein [Neptunicella marina]MBC3765519.1 acyltransferase family protein [Neptunicella marina]
MTTQSHRLDYLDAARALALLLGIVFHASLSFMPIFIGWAVMDVSTSKLVPYFVLISHSFRMELFFLIAGFFSHMTFHRAGWRTFVKSRAVKIAVPLVVGWFLLRPLLVSGWIMGAQSMRGDADITGALQQGFAGLRNFTQEFLTGTHLWFLYYLLLVTTIVLLLRTLISLNTELKARLGRLADKFVKKLCNSPLGLYMLALPLVAGLWYMQHWGVDTPDKSLIPSWPVTVIYTVFFALGWLLHRQSALITAFARLSISKVLLCIAASVSCVQLSAYEMQTSHGYYLLIKTAYLLSYALMMCSLIALTLGLCHKLFHRASPVVRYLADASYWLYLIHLPLVIWLQIAFAELPFHWSLKLLAVCGITIGLSLLIYDLFIRSTFIGAVLNGKRKSRKLFSRRHSGTTKTIII